jgi:hypothetical protein
MSRIVKASTAVAVYGLFLALVGMPVAVVQERVQGMETPDAGVNIQYD